MFTNIIFLFLLFYLPNISSDLSSDINKCSDTDVLLFKIADNFNNYQSSDPVSNEMLNGINIGASTSKESSIYSNISIIFTNS